MYSTWQDLLAAINMCRSTAIGKRMAKCAAFTHQENGDWLSSTIELFLIPSTTKKQ
jgi:hypothetical protein